MSRRDFNETNGPIRFKESLRFDDKFSQLYQRTDHHGVFPGRDILYQLHKCMQISIHYQRQHFISRGATEQEVSSIESYGIVVYQRKFTFYVMHRTNGGSIIQESNNRRLFPLPKLTLVKLDYKEYQELHLI
ncbi:unnamed protein product [Rhizophagus irregularis]|nr:unnamed protein product [Rhizophagus irregularis]CAB5368979.1 unnamed protein product [Rhizophagus irregularis]